MTRGHALVAVVVGLVTIGGGVGTLRAAPAQAQQTRTRATAPVPTPSYPATRVTRALSIPSPVCTVAGWLSGLAGTLCSVARKGGELLSAGGKLGGSAATAAKVVTVASVLTGLAVWVTGAGHDVLSETATVIGSTTRPQLEGSWFSSSYWRMAAIGMLLTVPFLFAACVQGLMRSDPSLIGRAALGYLPLAVLGISLAAPLTTLLLSVSDGLSTLIAGAAGQAPGAALAKLAAGTGLLAGASRSTFIALVIGLVTVAATLTLWVELLIRAAAVYVIVLMLPVVFAALVWPARRVWAIRSVETLVALILAKFAIVAVLSLGGAAIGHGVFPGWAAALAGVTLVMLAAFSPWALLRLLPLHEMASCVAGLSSGLSRPMSMLDRPAPQTLDERPPSPDPPPDPATISAAQMVVRGLKGDRAPIASDDQTDEANARDGATPATGAGDHAAPAADRLGVPGPAGAAGPDGVPKTAEAPATPNPSPGDIAGGVRERMPGMGPRWQLEDGRWPTLVLGPEQRTEDATGSEPTPGAPPAMPEPAVAEPPIPSEAPHLLGPVDQNPNPDAGGQ